MQENICGETESSIRGFSLARRSPAVDATFVQWRCSDASSFVYPQPIEYKNIIVESPKAFATKVDTIMLDMPNTNLAALPQDAQERLQKLKTRTASIRE